MKRNSSRTNPKRSLGGFTLVELIVVIAILAILAGVGAVAYTGYIEYAKKGQDRATVGEIINAIELADYADPTLFGDTNSAVIVLTEDGWSVLPSGSMDKDKLTSAIQDALGEPSGMTLKYDKWNGKPGNVTNVLNNVGKAQAYIKEMEDAGQYSAYADDMTEYWEAFTNLINNMNNGTLNLGSYVTGWNADDYDGAITEYIVSGYSSIGKDSTDATNIINAWKESGRIIDGTIEPFKGLDLTLARNYAFVSYARRQTEVPVTAAMQQTLTDYMNKLQSNSPDLASFDTSDTFNGSEWTTIKSNYFSKQAEADAKTYLSLMDAANAVYDTLDDKKVTGTNKNGGSTVLKDEVLLGAISEYVDAGVVGNILSGRMTVDSIQQMYNNIGDKNSVITVTATKVNGVWTPRNTWVNPKEANPREDGSKVEADNTPKKASTYLRIDLTNGSLTTSSGANVVALTAGGTTASNGGTVTASAANGSLNLGGKTVQSLSCNGENVTTGSDVEISGGAGTKIRFTNSSTNTVVMIKVGSATAPSQQSVTLTFSFTDGSSQSVSFTLYVIE